jgi:hypothetical protein
MTVAVGGRLPEHALTLLSTRCPIPMPTRSQLMRWAWALAAGMNHDDAIIYATNGKTLESLSEGSSTGTVWLSEDVVNKVRRQFPDRSNSWIMRYLVARHSGYGEKQSRAIADTDNRRKRNET